MLRLLSNRFFSIKIKIETAIMHSRLENVLFINKYIVY